mmetsp:Transcript_27426/g.68833  ORF Transcript_27426/g.68833 Transcript_27426/m.68833 type:complete len:147 (-) Transcript_27426:588-1028(-)
MSTIFRPGGWDPWLNLSAIVTNQSLFYILEGLFLFCIFAYDGREVALSDLFSQDVGWRHVACFLLTVVVLAFAFPYTVERAKKCLDYAFTVFFLHFLLHCALLGFPFTWQWWLLHGGCVVTLDLLSEQLCMRREMREIRLTMTQTV